MTTISNKVARGFTIIELLVVIVIIAILASVTIVTYSGVQARAEKVRTVSAVRSYEQALQLYKISENHYPLADYYNPIDPYSACLGTGYTDKQNINGTGLPDCRWADWGEVNPLADFNTELMKYAQVSATIPQVLVGNPDDGVIGMYFSYVPDATLDGQPQQFWLIYAVPDKTCGMTVPSVSGWPAYTSKNNDAVSEDFGSSGGLCHIPMK